MTKHDTHFTTTFQDSPGRVSQFQTVSVLDFIGAADDGCGGAHQQTNTQLFTGRMPFLSPNQQCQSSLSVLTAIIQVNLG